MGTSRGASRGVIAALTAALPLFATTDAAAQRVTQEACAKLSPDKQWQCRPPLRMLSIGLSAPKEYGLGGVARLRFNHIALEVGGGWLPFLTVLQYPNSNEIEFEFRSTGTVGGGVVLFISDHNAYRQHGVKINYVYNTLAGHAVGAGYAFDLSYSERMSFGFGGGLQVYFDAVDRLEREFPGTAVNALSVVQFYINAALHFWLL